MFTKSYIAYGQTIYELVSVLPSLSKESGKRQKCPAPGGHFHEDRTIYVVCREKCHAPDGHIFQPLGNIFELVQDINGTNLLTKFHDDRKINEASRVLTRKTAPAPWWPCFSSNLLTMQILTPHDGRRTKQGHLHLREKNRVDNWKKCPLNTTRIHCLRITSI
ncbi:hypothetical protein DPMN_161701 [Dreissena polymorpha]|uniref:Uncharacterized protein n=1 Tax=Dreissena polymorpha TaxID=45954 RepID=A0A9D4ISY2_DREPO|nr:hypothetical protein DPMN_161701 [Dreissena polymorpha]